MLALKVEIAVGRSSLRERPKRSRRCRRATPGNSWRIIWSVSSSHEIMSDNDALTYQQQLDQSRQLWDSAAASFDSEPDHGLHEPATLRAWTKLLRISLPSIRGSLLDIGCGTGSLSVVLAGLGYDVTGIDLSPEMISLAKAKALSA